jgi:hypothetical protein
MVRSIAIVLGVTTITAACGDDSGGTADASGDGGPADASVDAVPDADPLMPGTLADTGLCLDAGCSQIAPDVREYEPRWELYSDGATKRRWIYIPTGMQIDTTDMDYWQFPVGTKLWKEFTRDGTRVETRLMLRVGPLDDDWYMVPFVWNASQDAAVAMPAGQADANGTMHDVPSRPNCRQCHDNLPGRILGFGALQLDYDAAVGLYDLEDAIADGLLTTNPGGAGSPRFPLPTDAAQPNATDAIGYLHANCGNCHNPMTTVQRPIDLRLRVGLLGTLGETPTYASTNNVTGQMINGSTILVLPGDPAGSIVYQRFMSTNPSNRMPPLATEIIDDPARIVLETWITNIPP